MAKFRPMIAALAASLLAVAQMAPAAAAEWPTKTVNVIIPWAAGGGTDPLARLIFGDMAARLGQAFPLDFRPGASGTLGTNTAVKATPDGYTVLFTSGAPAVNANFMPNVAYNPKTDILPVAQVTESATFVVANANTPYNTFKELIDYAKANPGKINAAISGIGSGSHAGVATIQYKTGVKFNIVPYTGAGAQQADLMSGTVDLGFGFAAGFLPGVKAGKLKYIAALSDKREPNMPDVPSSDESGIKGVYRNNWFMAFVPKGTPRDIVEKINAEFKLTISKPEIKSQIEALGYAVVTGTPEAAAAVIAQDVTEMKEMIDIGVFKIE